MADGIILAGNSMRILDDKGNSRELTDFRIAVHYKIQRKSGTSYIVSLIKDDSEIKHVEWPMSFSEMKISEFVS